MNALTKHKHLVAAAAEMALVPDYSLDELMTEFGRATLDDRYLVPGEKSPQDAFLRAAKAWADNPAMAARLYFYVSQGWFMFATPVLSNAPVRKFFAEKFEDNFKAECFEAKWRGLPISCLPGDAIINTRAGSKYMRDIQVGDLVLTHRGRFRPVVVKQSRQSQGDMFELVVAGRSTRIRITGNHPIKTNLGWVRVDELDPKKHLAAVNGTVEFAQTPYVLDTWKHCSVDNDQPRNGRFVVTMPTRHVEVDEDLAWAIGLWFAEGSVSIGAHKQPNGLRITVGAHEKDFAERWLRIMCSKFGLNGNSYESTTDRVLVSGRTNKWLSVNLNSVVLGRFFTAEFGRGAKQKQLTEGLVSLPLPHARALLDGILDGDGCYTREGRGFSLTLANPHLVSGVYNLCLKLGVRVTTNHTVKAGKLASERWVHSIAAGGAWRNTLRKAGINQGIAFEDGLIYTPIRSVRRLEQDEEVFDIQVLEDESFSVAGVVVHNCFLNFVPDSVVGLTAHQDENGILSAKGGGIGGYWGAIRSGGTKTSNGSESLGIMPHLKHTDSGMMAYSQGATRRGSYAAYLDISHPEIVEFLEMRKPTGGDVNRKCLNLHNAINIPDAFMEIIERCTQDPAASDAWDLIDPHSKQVIETVSAKELWQRLLDLRMQTGEPYIHFIDATNRALPEAQKALGLRVNQSNLCSEITLATNAKRTAVCCLSSVNAAKFDEWEKHPHFVADLIRMLDNVLQFFILNAKTLKPAEIEALRAEAEQFVRDLGIQLEAASLKALVEGIVERESTKYLNSMGRAVYSATCERSVGLGLLGFHSYLQAKRIPFEDFQATMANRRMFSLLKRKADAATRQLAVERGECPDGKGTGVRNMHLLSVAPNASTSIFIPGGGGASSPSVEPMRANAFTHKTKSGSWLVKNPGLIEVLESYGMNTDEVWSSVITNKGSVQHLDFLSPTEKAVFKTAMELDQMWLIEHAAHRQEFICQSQSLNIFLPADVEISYLHHVHFQAWKKGLKTMYYLRSESIRRADNVSMKIDRAQIASGEAVCLSCEG